MISDPIATAQSLCEMFNAEQQAASDLNQRITAKYNEVMAATQSSVGPLAKAHLNLKQQFENLQERFSELKKSQWRSLNECRVRLQLGKQSEQMGIDDIPSLSQIWGVDPTEKKTEYDRATQDLRTLLSAFDTCCTKIEQTHGDMENQLQFILDVTLRNGYRDRSMWSRCTSFFSRSNPQQVIAVEYVGAAGPSQTSKEIFDSFMAPEGKIITLLDRPPISGEHTYRITGLADRKVQDSPAVACEIHNNPKILLARYYQFVGTQQLPEWLHFEIPNQHLPKASSNGKEVRFKDGSTIFVSEEVQQDIPRAYKKMRIFGMPCPNNIEEYVELLDKQLGSDRRWTGRIVNIFYQALDGRISYAMSACYVNSCFTYRPSRERETRREVRWNKEAQEIELQIKDTYEILQDAEQIVGTVAARLCWRVKSHLLRISLSRLKVQECSSSLPSSSHQ